MAAPPFLCFSMADVSLPSDPFSLRSVKFFAFRSGSVVLLAILSPSGSAPFLSNPLVFLFPINCTVRRSHYSFSPFVARAEMRY